MCVFTTGFCGELNICKNVFQVSQSVKNLQDVLKRMMCETSSNGILLRIGMHTNLCFYIQLYRPLHGVYNYNFVSNHLKILKSTKPVFSSIQRLYLKIG